MQKVKDEIFSNNGDRRLGILFESASCLAELNEDEDIYECLASHLVSTLSDAICIISSYDEIGGFKSICSVKGLDNQYIDLENTLGQPVIGMQISVDHSDYKQLADCHVKEIKGGLSELLNCNIEKHISQSIENLLNIVAIYTYSLSWKNEIYGDVSILLRKDQSSFDKALVRVIIQQAVISIRKRRITEELKKRESLLEGVFKTSVLGMALLDLNRKIYFVNPAFCNLVGYSEEEILSNTIQLTHPDDLAKEERNLDSLYYGKYSHNTSKRRFIHKNGSIIWVEYTSTIQRNHSGEPEFFIIQVKDITDTKTIEESLKETEANLKAVFNVSSNFILLTDVEGQILEINKTFSDQLGIPREEMIGKNIFSYISPEIRDSRIKYFQDVVHNGLAVQFEDSENGNTWQNLIYPIKDECGKTIRLATYGNNITLLKAVDAERKQLIEDLTVAKERAIQSDLLKSSLLSNMSHEFRTPLNGILGFAEILHESITDPSQGKMVEVIKDSGRRLFQTLDDILTIAELDSSSCTVKLSAIDPWILINGLISRFQSEIARKSLSLNTQIADFPEFELVSDKDLIEKALERILRNAIKFTESGGITITTRKISNDESHVLIISISDTGIGIAAEDQEKIFKSFRQVSEGMGREFEGNGLGLSIAQKLIQLLNGIIRVSSQKGVGTTFTVELPLRLKSKNISVNAQETDKTGFDHLQDKIEAFGRKPKVLLVEDNESNAILAISFLEKYCEIIQANDGNEAISKANENLFDLILMDINLGLGINGIEATREIRKIAGYENIPVAALTGYVLRGEQDKLHSLGLTHYLGKPYRMIELHDLVCAMLSQIIKDRS